jgi:hypothetical protein
MNNTQKLFVIMVLVLPLTGLAIGYTMSLTFHVCPEMDLMAISQVQRELCNRGYPVAIDGIYGIETERAWKQWEKDELNKAGDYWYRRMGGEE